MPHDWLREYLDLEVKKMACLDSSQDSGETSAEFMLVCGCCCLEVSLDPAERPYSCIKEHVALARHNRLKVDFEKAEQAKTKQQTVFNSTIREPSKEKEAEGAIHNFVRAV